MTRIWTFSDVHDDYHPWRPPDPPPPHDVLVIAGDHGECLTERVLPSLAYAFRNRPLIYVPGNHDFWRCRIEGELECARALCAELGITLLAEGERAVFDGVRFVGATLWSDYRIRGSSPVAKATAIHTMLDHKRISRSGGRWRPQDAEFAHVTQRRRIEDVLATRFDGPTVVVTHHAPHPSMLRYGEATDWLDGSYASDLSEILHGDHAPAVWISGHTHVQRDERVGGTRLVSNPRGYVEVLRGGLEMKVENPDFDPSFVVEVGP